MNAHLRQIDEWRRSAVRKEPARIKGRNGPGLAIRERTTGPEPTREGADPVLIRDELWSILQRMRLGGHAEDAARLERVYLLGGSVAAEGKMRVHRAREIARGVSS